MDISNLYSLKACALDRYARIMEDINKKMSYFCICYLANVFITTPDDKTKFSKLPLRPSYEKSGKRFCQKMSQCSDTET